MADLGHRMTDEELAKLERKIARLYSAAAKDLKAKADDYFAKFKVRDEEMKALLDDGKITAEYYKNWRLAQMGRGERVLALSKDCAKRVTEANTVAAAYINDTTPSIMSLNHNYAAYEIESVAGDVGFTMWDESTVRNLMTQNEHNILPEASVNVPKDELWNRKKISNEITSGILQGESIDKIANRFQRVTLANRSSAIRNARTAVTGAQNSGRQSSYEQASDMGIEILKEWVATLDERTRDSHRDLDGERVPYDKPFSNGLMYPADRNGSAGEVFNCRCTMVAVLPQYTGAKTRITYREWEARKVNEESTKSTENDSFEVLAPYWEYAEKLKTFGENEAATHSIINQSKAILKHRKNTAYEDMAFIDSTNGKWKTQRNHNVESECIATKEMIKMVSESKPYTIISMHNHPRSKVPSIADLDLAYKHKYKYGVILCHNGTVIKYNSDRPVSDDFFLNIKLNRLDSCIKDGTNSNKKEIDNIVNELYNLGIRIEVI